MPSPSSHNSPAYQMGEMPGRTPLPMPSIDRMQVQPTYSVENVANSYGHADAYDNTHPPHRYPQGQQDYALSPSEHHDAYYNQPYEPQHDGQQYWDEEPDHRPMLGGPQGSDLGRRPSPPSPTPTPMIRRWKTVKEVQVCIFWL